MQNIAGTQPDDPEIYCHIFSLFLTAEIAEDAEEKFGVLGSKYKYKSNSKNLYHPFASLTRATENTEGTTGVMAVLRISVHQW